MGVGVRIGAHRAVGLPGRRRNVETRAERAEAPATDWSVMFPACFSGVCLIALVACLPHRASRDMRVHVRAMVGLAEDGITGSGQAETNSPVDEPVGIGGGVDRARSLAARILSRSKALLANPAARSSRSSLVTRSGHSRAVLRHSRARL